MRLSSQFVHFIHSVSNGLKVHTLLRFNRIYVNISQPSECGRQRTLISVHAQTAPRLQSNGNSEARMSQKCGEWKD